MSKLFSKAINNANHILMQGFILMKGASAPYTTDNLISLRLCYTPRYKDKEKSTEHNPVYKDGESVFIDVKTFATDKYNWKIAKGIVDYIRYEGEGVKIQVCGELRSRLTKKGDKAYQNWFIIPRAVWQDNEVVDNGLSIVWVKDKEKLSEYIGKDEDQRYAEKIASSITSDQRASYNYQKEEECDLPF
jgi:hypothetical protein